MTNHPSVASAPFGVLPSGDSVPIYTITNRHGLEVRAIPFGAVIVSIRTPDRDGAFADITLGFDSLAGYEENAPYFGALVGRYANRIARGRFTLDGTTYRLATNNGVNALHGGVRGFNKVLWQASPFEHDSSAGVEMRYTSPDGEEGYPGTLQVRVTYTLTDQDRLEVDYAATTDKATPVNLSQHSYFNLAGEGSGDVLRHVLTISADRFVPVDSTLIPTGELQPVQGTAFDFRTPTPIGARIEAADMQLADGHGYDHTFVLNRSDTGLVHAVHVAEPTSGRTLDVWTTEPGVQFYTGNFLDGTVQGKNGHAYVRRGGFCLETQHFPDSPNEPRFPPTILRPGEAFQSRTVFGFGKQ